MKDNRIGEALWDEWYGEGYDADLEDIVVYYTFDHVDISHDVVRRALASAIQRDGVVDSLGDGFKAIETAKVVQGWVGFAEGEHVYSVCDYVGETYFGDFVDDVREITWVEFGI